MAGPNMESQQNISSSVESIEGLFLNEKQNLDISPGSKASPSITSEQYIRIYSDIYSSNYPNELEIAYNSRCQKGLKTKAHQSYKAGDVICTFVPKIRVSETYPHEGSEDYRCNCCATCNAKGGLERITFDDMESRSSWRTEASPSAAKVKKRKNRYGLLVCEYCSFISYCSDKCKNEDWEKFHKYECSFIKRCRNSEALPLPSSKILSIVRLIIWSCESQENFSMFKNFASHSSKFKQIHEDYLKVKNEKEHTKEKKKNRDFDLNNLNLLNKKIMSEFFQWIDILTEFKNEQVSRPEVSKQTRKYLNVINVIAVFLVNSAILQNCFLESTGFLFDPTIALLNHSCKPNITLLFDGNKISLISSEDLVPNQELYISYCYLENPKFIRNFELKQKFYFDCECELCEKENFISINPEIQKHEFFQANYMNLLFSYWNHNKLNDSTKQLRFFDALMSSEITNVGHKFLLFDICKLEFGLTVSQTFYNVNLENLTTYISLIDKIYFENLQERNKYITLNKYPINRIIERLIISSEENLEKNWRLFLKFYLLNLFEVKSINESSKFKATLPFCLRELAFTFVRIAYLNCFDQVSDDGTDLKELKRLQRNVLYVGIYIGLQSYTYLRQLFKTSPNNDIIKDTTLFIKDLKNNYPADWSKIQELKDDIVNSSLKEVLYEVGIKNNFGTLSMTSNSEDGKLRVFLPFDQLIMSDFHK